MMQPLNVFIVYAPEDKESKDELAKILQVLQGRGFVDSWQDFLIEPGNVWHSSLEAAVNACTVMILLVSLDYLSSSFATNKAVSQLLKARRAEGMVVVPIIVRSCDWMGDSMIGMTQVLPLDGTPIMTASKENGDRDRLWARIAHNLNQLIRKIQNDPM